MSHSRVLALAMSMALMGCWGRSTSPDGTPYDHIELEPEERPRVRIETSMGRITIELLPNVAYKHCQNMIYLARFKFYDGTIFHRIIPGFVIQGGDPTGLGEGGPGYMIPPELSDVPFEKGTVGGVRLGSDTDENGSQFFIALGRLTSLDGKYTVFARVIEGMDVLEDIASVRTGAGDRPLAPVVVTRVRVES